MVKRALVSVYNKEGIIGFTKKLRQNGIELLTTGGTYNFLKDNGIDAIKIKDYTGFPEIFGGRVKTLHPKIEGGILFRRDNPVDNEEKDQHGILPIDMVVCNLYPFEDAYKNKELEDDELVEYIDIGGPTMIRAAAKNFRDVIVVVDPSDYAEIIEKIESKEEFSLEERKQFAAKAFNHTAYYDSLIASAFRKSFYDFSSITFSYKKEMKLRYGENPHQDAYLYIAGDSKKGLPYEKIYGKELSYNNLVDIDSAINIIMEFSEPAAVLIKHSNPCGLAIDDDIHNAFIKAKGTDPLSAFGSIIGINREVDKELALMLNEFFNECIIAPSYSQDAMEILLKKKNRRILKLKDNFKFDDYNMVKINGGILIQDKDLGFDELMDIELVSGEPLSKEKMEDLFFAWKAVKFVKSNAIVLAKDKKIIGIGAGQMSRVDAVKIAFRKCKENLHDPEGAILASDAFFPFRDNIDFCSEYNIAAIIQPGGSKRDGEVIEAANEHNITMYFTGRRHFRH